MSRGSRQRLVAHVPKLRFLIKILKSQHWHIWGEAPDVMWVPFSAFDIKVANVTC